MVLFFLSNLFFWFPPSLLACPFFTTSPFLRKELMLTARPVYLTTYWGTQQAPPIQKELVVHPPPTCFSWFALSRWRQHLHPTSCSSQKPGSQPQHLLLSSSPRPPITTHALSLLLNSSSGNFHLVLLHLGTTSTVIYSIPNSTHHHIQHLSS